MAQNNPGRPARLLILLGLFGAFQAAASLIPGRLVADRLAGDALHLLDGAARVAQGQVPHLDFSTPLGALTFQAVAMWDASAGMALIGANLLAMALCLPPAVWLGASRLSFGAALALGLCAMTLAAAHVWTALAPGSTPAANYNRWGWAAMALVLPVLLVPPRRPGRAADWGDGLVLGLAGALTLFVKATFVAALGPAWLVWALTGRGRAALISAVAAAAGIAALLPATGGIAAAVAYVGDLAAVARSDHRATPGAPLGAIALAPLVLPLTLGCLAGALALLRAGLGRAAGLFALGAAAVFLAAWQNYGNHPTGAVALPFALLALAPRAAEGARAFGRPAGAALRTLAVALLALTLPPFLNMQRSVLSGWAPGPDAAPLPGGFAPDILWNASRPMAATPLADPATERFGGVEFPECRGSVGYEQGLAGAAAALAADPALRGRTVLTADVTNAAWLLAGAPPQPGVEIWLYAPPTAALAAADLLAVPRCPSIVAARATVLAEARSLGLTGEPVARTPLWTIFALSR